MLSALGLAGCAAPLGLTVASYGIDGVGYVTEGQSTTDMAISGVQGEHCALWHVVVDKPVCRPFTDAEKAQLAHNREEIKRGHPEVVLMGEGQDLDAVAEPIPPRIPPLGKEAPGTLVADASAPAAASHDQDAPPALPVAAVTTHRLDAPAAERPRPIPVRPIPLRPIPVRGEMAAAPAPARTAKSGGVYLVVGSFSSVEKARHARDAYAKTGGQGLSLALLDGPSLHRVASGPWAPGEVEAARGRLARTLGVAKPWAVPACPSQGGPGCAVQARLGIAHGGTELAALSD